jgi:murein DD-endopeptidase MepM/ murein hydrolase activator NlpD
LKNSRWINLLLVMVFLCPLGVAQAQEVQPDGPVYIVEAGDTLWGISQRFGVSIDDLAKKNGITDTNQLAIGAQLVIPGLEGLQGVLVTRSVPFGESLISLSRRYQIPFPLMVRLNNYTNPEEAYAGSTLILPDPGDGVLEPTGGRGDLGAGQSLLEMAIIRNINPWALVFDNGLQGMWDTVPGDVLYIAGVDDPGPGAFPTAISEIAFSPLPAVQGQTVVLRISTPEKLTLSGDFVDHNLNFFQDSDGRYVALQGIHALKEAGVYPVRVQGTLADGTPFVFSQMIYVQDGGYPYDPPLAVKAETTDVENTLPEDQEWFSIVEPVTPEKLWDGIFQPPVPAYLADCFPSRFGNRRSYNGSVYEFFHTGLDFCGGTGVDIYAPAAGVVVFTGPLTVRGNATLIDHGWGVYTGYGHQSEILVTVGDRVETGQLIGKIGSTGRVTGPHLHWEVIIGGVQVDPLQWLERAFP